MRQFYALHAQRIGQTASGLFETQTRSHYVFLLGIKKADERRFYEIESTQAEKYT